MTLVVVSTGIQGDPFVKTSPPPPQKKVPEVNRSRPSFRIYIHVLSCARVLAELPHPHRFENPPQFDICPQKLLQSHLQYISCPSSYGFNILITVVHVYNWPWQTKQNKKESPMLITIIKATAAAARPLYIIKMRNADENGELIGRPRFWPPTVFVTIADNNPCAGEIVRYIYI